MIELPPQNLASAAELVDPAPNGLRTGDALHLAIVHGHGRALATFDQELAAAARASGVVAHPFAD